MVTRSQLTAALMEGETKERKTATKNTLEQADKRSQALNNQNPNFSSWEVLK